MDKHNPEILTQYIPYLKMEVLRDKIALSLEALREVEFDSIAFPRVRR